MVFIATVKSPKLTTASARNPAVAQGPFMAIQVVNPISNTPASRRSARRVSTGNLTIDPTRREVMLDSRQIDLTAREFDLLDYFARNPGRVFRRADLLDKVWGYGHEGYEHTVNSHINRLRAKIESDPSKPEMIVTVWGVGYKFSSCDSTEVAV